MCLYGNYKVVKIINTNQNKTEVLIDACIAEEIEYLNKEGVITIGCCCCHGETGMISEYENAFGKWKEKGIPPHSLINKESKELCEKLGYRVLPYYYADGTTTDARMIYLKSGCIDVEECKEWHTKNNIPFIKNIGIIK